MNKMRQELHAVSAPDYMRIRKYVLTLISSGTSESRMLPPMVELARQFGVTRMTVHKALKDLIRDKYLISRKGVGTFLNPSRLREDGPQPGQRQIALIAGEGKHCYYDRFYWEHLAALGLEITRCGHLVSLVNLLSGNPEDMVKELRNNFVEGVVWVDAYGAALDVMKILHAQAVPVVSVHQPVAGVNSVGMDYVAHAADIGRKLLAEGRRNLVFAGLDNVPAVKSQLEALRTTYKDAGQAVHERLILRNPDNMRQELQTILDFGVEVQALYITGPHLPLLLPVLREKHVDISRTCRIICEPFDAAVRDQGFVGWVREYQCQAEAEKTLEMMGRMLTHKDFRVETALLPFQVCPLNLPDD